MAQFYGQTVDQIRQVLSEKLLPVYSQAVEIAVKLCEERLIEKLAVPYPGASASTVKFRKGKWGSSSSSAAKKTEYPRRRSGTLQQSIGSTKAVVHKNIYKISASFGVVRNAFHGATKTRQNKHATLFKKHQERSGSFAGYKGPSSQTKPSLYAHYLEHGTKNKDGSKRMAPRKLTKSIWNEVKYSGELTRELKKLKGAGSRIVKGGKSPNIGFKFGTGS